MQRRCVLVGYIFRDVEEILFFPDCVACERPDMEATHPVHDALGTEGFLSSTTLRAMATAALEVAEADIVTLIQCVDFKAEFMYDAYALMTKHLVGRAIVLVCAAEAAVDDLYEDLVTLKGVWVGRGLDSLLSRGRR